MLYLSIYSTIFFGMIALQLSTERWAQLLEPAERAAWCRTIAHDLRVQAAASSLSLELDDAYRNGPPKRRALEPSMAAPAPKRRELEPSVAAPAIEAPASSAAAAGIDLAALLRHELRAAVLEVCDAQSGDLRGSDGQEVATAVLSALSDSALPAAFERRALADSAKRNGT